MVYFMFFFFFWDTVPFELCRNKKFIRFIKVVRFIFMALSIVFTIIEEGFSHPFILLYLAVSFISQYHLNLRYILSYAGLVLYNIPSLWANIDIEFNALLKKPSNSVEEEIIEEKELIKEEERLVIEELREININRLTPLDAMMLIDKLKKSLEN